jgi:hypothetical protein
MMIGERNLSAQMFLKSLGFACTVVTRGHYGEDAAVTMTYVPDGLRMGA